MLRHANVTDAPAIAALFRLVRRTCLAYLPDLHTPASELLFFRDHVLPTREVWCAGDARIDGFIAFGDGWVDHLYVHPARHKAGIGTALLAPAQASAPSLQLWVFQRNIAAIGFYRARGFHLVEETDGMRNEEREPDARYAWHAPP
jgi:ribosomal protein S18 acetylase RimI-like enzyme